MGDVCGDPEVDARSTDVLGRVVEPVGIEGDDIRACFETCLVDAPGLLGIEEPAARLGRGVRWVVGERSGNGARAGGAILKPARGEVAVLRRLRDRPLRPPVIFAGSSVEETHTTLGKRLAPPGCRVEEAGSLDEPAPDVGGAG